MLRTCTKGWIKVGREHLRVVERKLSIIKHKFRRKAVLSNGPETS
jgi:hypothetical protein